QITRAEFRAALASLSGERLPFGTPVTPSRNQSVSEHVFEVVRLAEVEPETQLKYSVHGISQPVDRAPPARKPPGRDAPAQEITPRRTANNTSSAVLW